MTEQPTMCTFDLQFSCDECSQIHHVGFRLIRNFENPPEIGDPYGGIKLPAEVMKFVNNSIPCPTTGELTLVRNNDQTFLVRVA